MSSLATRPRKFKILMLGWEFPPNITGGLGTACFGMTRAMDALGHTEVVLVLPGTGTAEDNSYVDIVGLELDNHTVASAPHAARSAYESTLLPQVQAYAAKALHLFGELEDFDILHAHDWLTAPAAMAIKRISKKPLVLHIHSTEYDRAGCSPNPTIVAIEQAAMDSADRIIAVSNFTKNILIDKYHQSCEKILVVYNGVDSRPYLSSALLPKKAPIVSFLGRITHQKGPSYFILAAQRIWQRRSDVQFMMAGEGDLQVAMMDLAQELGLSAVVHFPGFLSSDEVDHLLERSRVYVMPSVSEPFGISALEAVNAGVPIVISRQSGVAEVLKSSLKVDYWDVSALAQAVLTLLDDAELANSLASEAASELVAYTWTASAKLLTSLYAEVAGTGITSREGTDHLVSLDEC